MNPSAKKGGWLYDLEQRFEKLEKKIGALSQPAHGCICPVGAEVTCKGTFCPRRAMKPSVRCLYD